MFPKCEDSTIEDPTLDFCGVHRKPEKLKRSFGHHNLELRIPEWPKFGFNVLR